MLPKSLTESGTVELSGGPVEIRPLTADEVGRAKGKNALAIAIATGSPLKEVEAWLKDAIAGDVAKLLAAILKISGLTEGAQKSN